MRTARRSVRGVARVLFLVALLLVALALGGHGHANHQVARSCAVCLAAHHTPGLVTPGVGVAANFVEASAPLAVPELIPLPAARSPHRGRAPPLAASSPLA